MLGSKKTYIVAGIVAVATFAQAVGWITQEQYQIILGILGSLGLAALRSGVSTEAAKTKDVIQTSTGIKIVEQTPVEAAAEEAKKNEDPY